MESRLMHVVHYNSADRESCARYILYAIEKNFPPTICVEDDDVPIGQLEIRAEQQEDDL